MEPGRKVSLKTLPGSGGADGVRGFPSESVGGPTTRSVPKTMRRTHMRTHTHGSGGTGGGGGDLGRWVREGMGMGTGVRTGTATEHCQRLPSSRTKPTENACAAYARGRTGRTNGPASGSVPSTRWAGAAYPDASAGPDSCARAVGYPLGYHSWLVPGARWKMESGSGSDRKRFAAWGLGHRVRRGRAADDHRAEDGGARTAEPGEGEGQRAEVRSA